MSDQAKRREGFFWAEVIQISIARLNVTLGCHSDPFWAWNRYYYWHIITCIDVFSLYLCYFYHCFQINSFLKRKEKEPIRNRGLVLHWEKQWEPTQKSKMICYNYPCSKSENRTQFLNIKLALFLHKFNLLLVNVSGRAATQQSLISVRNPSKGVFLVQNWKREKKTLFNCHCSSCR